MLDWLLVKVRLKLLFPPFHLDRTIFHPSVFQQKQATIATKQVNIEWTPLGSLLASPTWGGKQRLTATNSVVVKKCALSISYM